MPCFPDTPPNARQTNCWKFILILNSVIYVLDALVMFIQGQIGLGVGYLFDLLIFLICMYHTAYVQVDVNEQGVEITMGPWQWPLFSWCCSSQVSKEEIVLIERKQRQCLYDICPRLYCSPIMWCCCHKSYSAYFWPCCCQNVQCCQLCDGDSDSSDMIQINLTNSPQEFSTMCFKRCAPCPLPWSLCVCCVYNRIAVSIRDETTWQTIQSCGYPLAVGQENERTALASGANTAAGVTPEGNTPV